MDGEVVKERTKKGATMKSEEKPLFRSPKISPNVRRAIILLRKSLTKAKESI